MINILNPLSTLIASQNSRRDVARLQVELQQASQEVSSGVRANVFADLGQTASIPMLLRAQMDQTDAFAQSNALLGNKLDVMATALGSVHDSAQSVIAQAVANLQQPGADAATLQQTAKAALDQITTALNANFAGEYLFSGTTSNQPPLQVQSQTNSATGLSPQGVIAGIVGAGPTSAADAATKAGQIDAVFNSTTGTGQDFEATFYNGTHAKDASGNPNPRVTGQIDRGQNVDYGIQANDSSIRGILKGLTMLASTDPSKISDPGAYKAWMASAVGALSDGIAGLTDAQAQLGSQQKLVSDIATRQSDLKSVYTNRINAFEGVDSYTAASRLTQLQTQLQATYAATAQISKLSILNYM